MSLADNIKRLREQKQFSQKELAEMVGIAQPTISQYEKGLKIPTAITAVDLARKLDTTVEDLVYGARKEQTE